MSNGVVNQAIVSRIESDDEGLFENARKEHELV